MLHTLRSHVAAHGEAGGAVRVLAIVDAEAPGDRHVVYDPLLHVVIMYMGVQKLDLLDVFLVGVGIVTIAQKFWDSDVLCKVELQCLGYGRERCSHHNAAGEDGEGRKGTREERGASK